MGDSGRDAVFFFNKQGKLVSTIGGKGRHRRGPWDPQRVDKVSAVAIDANGKVWVCESSYQPKRVSRFSMDGQCGKEFFGPPEYGGGGYLDPSLKSFYYRGLEFALDWEQGTSRLKNLNDRCYTEETPALEASTFAYTRIGYPIYYQGRKYIVGTGVVCLMDGDVWKPCAVMGGAHGSVFLLRKQWAEHWKKMDLTDKAFIWCDHNGDGKYQIEEVDLFDTKEFGYPFRWPYWGTKPGPDLTFWSGGWRMAPVRITDQGVPIYDRRTFQRAGYDQPVYLKNVTFGMRATPSYTGCRWLAQDGSTIQNGQPYVLRKDGTYLGGRPNARPSDYIPSINGNVIEHALSYVGGAMTESPVGEVAVLNGNNGVWSVVSVRDRVLLDQLFTGKDGGWSTDLVEQRGMDVTGRRHGGETFFGNFIKAHNGKYYTVAGKGFHGICRIEGLDDYQVTTANVSVTAESVAANRTLRTALIKQARAWQVAAEKRRTDRVREIRRLDERMRSAVFKLDGGAADWGGKGALQPIDEQWAPEDPPPKLFFDAAYDDEGLYLVYRGLSRTGSNCDDWKFIFKTGFCFDFQYRSVDDDSRSVTKGDRRIVFGRFRAQWMAVMYDYVDDKTEPEKHEVFASPVVTTIIARVYRIPADRLKLRVDDDNLDILGEEEELPGHHGWSAEAFLPWKTLGLSKPKELRCDVGVMNADSGGITVERRDYWANPAARSAVNDLGVEAAISPGKWGMLKLK